MPEKNIDTGLNEFSLSSLYGMRDQEWQDVICLPRTHLTCAFIHIYIQTQMLIKKFPSIDFDYKTIRKLTRQHAREIFWLLLLGSCYLRSWTNLVLNETISTEHTLITRHEPKFSNPETTNTSSKQCVYPDRSSSSSVNELWIRQNERLFKRWQELKNLQQMVPAVHISFHLKQSAKQLDRTAFACEIGVSASQGRNESSLSGISYWSFYYNYC